MNEQIVYSVFGHEQYERGTLDKVYFSKEAANERVKELERMSAEIPQYRDFEKHDEDCGFKAYDAAREKFFAENDYPEEMDTADSFKVGIVTLVGSNEQP